MKEPSKEDIKSLAEAILLPFRTHNGADESQYPKSSPSENGGGWVTYLRKQGNLEKISDHVDVAIEIAAARDELRRKMNSLESHGIISVSYPEGTDPNCAEEAKIEYLDQGKGASSFGYSEHKKLPDGTTREIGPKEAIEDCKEYIEQAKTTFDKLLDLYRMANPEAYKTDDYSTDDEDTIEWTYLIRREEELSITDKSGRY